MCLCVYVVYIVYVFMLFMLFMCLFVYLFMLFYVVYVFMLFIRLSLALFRGKEAFSFYSRISCLVYVMSLVSASAYLASSFFASY
jgi:hypothetical protein